MVHGPHESNPLEQNPLEPRGLAAADDLDPTVVAHSGGRATASPFSTEEAKALTDSFIDLDLEF